MAPPTSLGAVPATGDGAPSAGAQRDGVGAEKGLPAAGVLDELSSALASARTAIANFLELLSLEARRAGLALVWMVVWGFVAAICIVAAWLGVMAALVLWAVSLGLLPIAAVLGVAVINCVAGAMLLRVCMNLSRDLLFAASRRQVAGKFPVKPPAP